MNVSYKGAVFYGYRDPEREQPRAYVKEGVEIVSLLDAPVPESLGWTRPDWARLNMGARRLAFLILAHVTNRAIAETLYNDFACEVVSNWDFHQFRMVEQDVIAWVLLWIARNGPVPEAKREPLTN